MSDIKTVREIAKTAFIDAAEILSIVEVLTAANKNGVTEKLNAAGAGRAAGHIQRALFTRLHIIVARHYTPLHKDDICAGQAFKLLKDDKLREEVAANDIGNRLAAAIDAWAACNADERLKAYMHVRHKMLAHLATPDPDIPIPMYDEVLAIAKNTAACINHLANGVGIISLEIETQIPAQKESALAFWAPWKSAE
jgi:HEPN superfamily AbiU2-like protein